MKKITQSLSVLMIGLACLLQSCQFSPLIPPTNTPAPNPTAQNSAISAPRQSSPAVLAACPTSDQEKALRQAYIPDWQNLGLFSCYELSLDLATTSPYPGRETLVFTNPTDEPLNDVVLRTFPNSPNIYGGNMRINSTRVDGQLVKTEFLLPDRSVLRVPLNQALLPSQTAVIHIEYSLEIPQGFNSNSTYGVFGQSTNGTIFTLANWFPILAVRNLGEWQFSTVLPGGDAVTSESALFKVSVTTPPGWKIAATGVEVSAIESEGRLQHQWVSGPVRDFMLTASPNFEMRQVQTGDVKINQWGLAETSPTWGTALETAKSSLEYYQKTFGPYPFTKLDVVAVPLQYASGVEYPGLILISEKAYLPTSRAGLLQVVVAHETAHQWWYSIIGNDVLRNPWLDEGLTTFTAYAYLRDQGSPIYTYLEKDYQDQVSAYDKEHPNESIAQPLSAFKDRTAAYSTLVYVKAALFFEQVRQHIGDQNFDQALLRYFSDNMYRLVSPSDLLVVFTRSCGCDLSDIYRKYGVENINLSP